MNPHVGQKVHSYRVGAVPGLDGEIISIVEDYKQRRFCVVADKSGRSWYRDFHEVKPLDEVA